MGDKIVSRQFSPFHLASLYLAIASIQSSVSDVFLFPCCDSC